MSDHEAEEVGYDEEPEDERPRKWLRRLIIAMLVVFSFITGLLTGMMSDGTAESLQSFRQKAMDRVPAAGESSYPPIPTVVDSQRTPAATQTVPFPANNGVQWTTAVAPGTPLYDLRVQNNSTTANVILVFSAVDRTGIMNETARLWIRSAMPARISLPAGQYSIAILGYPVQASYDPQRGVAGRGATADLASDRPGTTLAVDGSGTLRVVQPRRTEAPSEEEAEEEYR